MAKKPKTPEQVVEDAKAILREHDVEVQAAIEILSRQVEAYVLIYTPDGESMSVATSGKAVAVRGLVGWFTTDWQQPEYGDEDGMGGTAGGDDEGDDE